MTGIREASERDVRRGVSRGGFRRRLHANSAELVAAAAAVVLDAEEAFVEAVVMFDLDSEAQIAYPDGSRITSEESPFQQGEQP